MSKWRKILVGDFADFNPSESIKKGYEAKKIPMDKLGNFDKKIKGFELNEYKSGPKFRNNDTLVAKITPCLENGKTAFVDILEDNEVAFGSSEFIVLRANQNSDSKFIYYLARSPLFRTRAISCMEGTSGRKRVNEGALKRQEILVPEISEQKKIASVLSALDTKIELNNKINAELEALAKTIYDYWFVQFDFPNDKGKPYKSSGGKMVWNKELKRETPEGWEVKRVEDLLVKEAPAIKIPASEFIETGDIPVIDQSTDFIAGFTNVTLSKINGSEIPRIIFGDHTRILKFINFDFARGADGTQVILSNNRQMPQCLFYHTLLKIDLSNYGYARHFKFLKDSLIIVPDKDTATLYEEKALSFYKMIKENIFQNQQLASLRDWLLPMLMNGQVKVKDAEKMVEEKLSIAAEGRVEYKKSKVK